MVTRLVTWWRQLGWLQLVALFIGLVVTLVRLSLVGKGTMAFIDEQRYVTAMLGLRSLGEGHVRDFLQAINSMGARPGDGLWRAIPGLGQAALLFAFQLNPNSPPSLQVPQVFNVLIMSLNALLLYRIYRRFFGVGFALLGVTLYSSLVNTNLYLRHILPYDHSLFFFLLALWLLLSQSERKTVWRYWLVGVISGFSYAVYPGYFMGPAVLLVLGALLALAPRFQVNKASVTGAIKLVGGQLAGLVMLLALFEGLAQFSDTSYVASSRYIASTVTQGSFAEGFSFIGQYFWQVEGWFGVALLVLFGAGLALSIYRLRPAVVQCSRGSTAPFSPTGLLLTGFVAWLGYAAVVLFAHQLVFYGRILHFFVPFLILGAIVALRELAGNWQEAHKTLLLRSGWALALWHFGTFAVAYRAVAYPCDVTYEHGIQDARQIAGLSTTGCDQNIIFYRVFGPRLRNQRTAAYPRYHLVNFAYLYPLSCYQARQPAAGKVTASVPYFMKYAPYQFEGHNAAQRALLQKYSYDFQIVAEK